MNFQHLNDNDLDQVMLSSVKAETNATLKVLHLLCEVDRRQLFSKLGYQSLIDYAIRRLGYSADQAWRRVDAMRLLKDVPEIEQKIADGSLNLTTIGYANAAFKAEAKNDAALQKEEKLNFLARIENKSTREVQKIVAEEFGKETLIRETVKPVTMTTSILNIPVTDEMLATIDELKGLLAHSHPGITTAELFSLLAQEKLASLKQKKAGLTKLSATTSAAPRKFQNEESSTTTSTTNAKNRYVTRAMNRALHIRDRSKCTNCGSTYALERDHRTPFAKGGRTSLDNLRLLCRNCNQRAAIEHYGIKKMSRFLKDRTLHYCV